MSRLEIVVRVLCGFCALMVFTPAGLARAHIEMSYPSPRTAEQKDGPCGGEGSVRGDTVAVFEPGETIVITWTETVNHTSHYRIAFDIDGDDDFVPPSDRDDLYNSPAVLVDGIEDRAGGNYSQEITLPDIECERCTLQLIQMMYGRGNYFQCADIVIRRDRPPAADAAAPFEDAGVPRGDAGSTAGTCSAAPGLESSAPSPVFAFGALMIALRRRWRGSSRSRIA